MQNEICRLCAQNRDGGETLVLDLALGLDLQRTKLYHQVGFSSTRAETQDLCYRTRY